MKETIIPNKSNTHEAIVPGTKFSAVGNSEENALDKLGTKLANFFGLSKGVGALERHRELLGSAQVSEIQKPKKIQKVTGAA